MHKQYPALSAVVMCRWKRNELRKSALQDSGLVRTVGSCTYAQRRVTLMPQAIARARDALSNDQAECYIAHLVGARTAACSEGCGLCNNRFSSKVFCVSGASDGTMYMYILFA